MPAIISFILPFFNIEIRSKQFINLITKLVSLSSEFELEIILVNDGSVDSSEYLVKKAFPEQGKIRLLNKKNGGLSDARNRGIEIARGKYVMFIDDDDDIDIFNLKKILKFCELNTFDLLRFGAIEISEDGCEVLHRCKNTDVFSGMESLEIQLVHDKLFYTPAWAYVYNSNLLKNNNFIVGIYHEDCEFIPRIFFFAKRSLTLDLNVYRYYRRSNSITTSTDCKKVKKRVSDLSLANTKITDLIHASNSKRHGDTLSYRLLQLLNYQRQTARSSKSIYILFSTYIHFMKIFCRLVQLCWKGHISWTVPNKAANQASEFIKVLVRSKARKAINAMRA